MFHFFNQKVFNKRENELYTKEKGFITSVPRVVCREEIVSVEGTHYYKLFTPSDNKKVT